MSMDQRKNTIRPGAWFQSHSYIGAWQGKKASSGRLGDGTEPVQLSSSAQGMSSGVGWGLGPASILPSSRLLERREQAMGARGRGCTFQPHLWRIGPLFQQGLGRAPPGRVTSHISHLIP